jgi:hypothetical protein
MLQELKDQVVNLVDVLFCGTVAYAGQQYLLPQRRKVRLKLVIDATNCS